ncbi:bifunctional 2-polyprenyl-6-hydroxyphenol methylase/3-demethylubiquinol 3-O-methyltransferase UbiG [Nonomuraea sp. C10]|uniref:class I SAM-dependent methyltransferase n=1 Tax=Nonomuraea sp. C10 TaxID=2600577 RepID=UPI0021C28F2B|nr:class I SAM-dependent methyltransferase [Nonomuraea sp. C10]
MSSLVVRSLRSLSPQSRHRRSFAQPAPARVLDVGGGTGVHAEWLAADGYDVELIDPVPLHVARAERLPGVTARLGHARALPARCPRAARALPARCPRRTAGPTRWCCSGRSTT